MYFIFLRRSLLLEGRGEGLDEQVSDVDYMAMGGQ